MPVAPVDFVMQGNASVPNLAGMHLCSHGKDDSRVCRYAAPNAVEPVAAQSTPMPKRAKSPRHGSSGKTSARLVVSRFAADMDATRLLSSPSLQASCTTCVSRGTTSVRLSMKSAHSPRSTGDPSRTIQRRNMHTRLQAERASLGTTGHSPHPPNRAHIAATALTASPPHSPRTNPPRRRT